MIKQPGFPPGWDEARVRDLLEHYEQRSDDQAVAENEVRVRVHTHTVMEVPVELVPESRHLIAKRRAS